MFIRQLTVTADPSLLPGIGKMLYFRYDFFEMVDLCLMMLNKKTLLWIPIMKSLNKGQVWILGGVIGDSPFLPRDISFSVIPILLRTD